MDGYRKYLESKFMIYADKEKHCNTARIASLEKLQYTMFVLNTGTCMLYAKLNKMNVNIEKIDLNNLFDSKFNVLLCGAFFAVLSILIGYISRIYSNKYSSKLREYEALKLKNISMFEDYISGKRYCDNFSLYITGHAGVEKRTLLQRNLAKYEELEKSNTYSNTISQSFEDVSVAYIFISFTFFCQAIGIFSFFPLPESDLLQNLYNHALIITESLFTIYCSYKMVVKLICCTLEGKSTELEISIKYMAPVKSCSWKIKLLSLYTRAIRKYIKFFT